ncbi:MAG TPA: DEAD/DEAH box helicase [Gemmatimonadaceae bacterium]|nr:DEAD/DEAH box helicase [Gemmatimonadaceae bacterium]
MPPGQPQLLPASLALSPQGHVYLEAHPPEGSVVDACVLETLRSAFERGPGAGLLRLGAMELRAPLPPTLAYWRDFSRQFLTRLCGLIGSGEQVHIDRVPPSPGLLESLAAGAPPMTGVEYLSPDALDAIWIDLSRTLLREATERGAGIQDYLVTLDPAWRLVGRVCLHLAELRDNAATPFAFLATYVRRVSHGGRAQHVRLGTAVQQATTARDRTSLLALLAPLERAAEESPCIKRLVESGDIYQTLAWTPRDAYEFLKAIPVLEASGVTVRVPDWWKGDHQRGLQVQVSIGGSEPSRFGRDALLDFSMRLALDGETLLEAEWDAMRRGTDGLAFVRGRWVEIDREKLEQVLAHWQGVQHAAANGQLSFGEGLRLLAGAPLGSDAAARAPDAVADWSRVDAGPWLREQLQALRSPDALRALELRNGFTATLRPYQSAGAHWLALLHGLGLGGCLADDMGLGKTVQMLALWSMLRARRPDAKHLLVVPASLLGNWQSESTRFAPSLRLFVAHPSVTPRDELAHRSASSLVDVDIVVTTYGYLHRLPWLSDIAWETIVLDEAQAIKNPGTKQARAAKALTARSRFALTGTPIENRLGDLWSLFDFLCPGLLGTAKAFSTFVKRLQQGGSAAYGPLRTLVQPYVLRRLKTDKRVIADLPDKTELRAFCSLTKAQAVLYQSSVDELAHRLDTLDGIERRGVILAFLMRFKQICNHPSQWLGDGAYEPVASGKFARLRELCETIAARQEKVLIFTQFREMTGPLSDFLAGVFERPGLVLHGGTSPRKRTAMVDAFQREDGPPFFVISLKAGGTGLNLTAASHVVHFDRWWNPAVENQATDRAYRIGQHRNVLVHKFVCRGTVEERIDALIASKVALSRDVLEGGGEAILTELGDEELISLVTLDLKRAVDEGT